MSDEVVRPDRTNEVRPQTDDGAGGGTARTPADHGERSLDPEKQNDDLRRAQAPLGAALEASEERCRSILETIEESYFEVDIAGKLTFFGDSLCQLLGYPRDELASVTDRQYTDAETAARLFQVFNAVFRTGETARGIGWEITRKDGIRRTVEASVSLRRDISGKPIGFRGVVRDVTERRRAEEALRESREMLGESQRIAGLGSYVLDIPAGEWARSDVLDSVFGIDDGYERTVTGWAALIHPADRTALVDYFTNEVVGKGQPFDREYRIVRHRDREVRWVHGLGRLELDPGGRPLKMRGTIQDITERKRAEEALAHSRAQLLQAQKLEAVGRLAGGVAHDFNNILQAMLSLATVLRLKAGSPELTRIVAEIEAHIERGAGLTQQLLLFSRRQVAERKRLDLGELAGAAGVLLRRLIPENIRLTVDTTPERLWVEGDAGQLQQVLMNLAVNAKDAMPGGGTLTLRTGAGGRRGGGRGDRHRARDGRGDARAPVRAVLHHEGGGEGHRAGAVGGARHRRAARRAGRGRERAGQGQHASASSCRRCRRRRRPRARRAPRRSCPAGTASGCWSSRTRTGRARGLPSC